MFMKTKLKILLLPAFFCLAFTCSVLLAQPKDSIQQIPTSRLIECLSEKAISDTGCLPLDYIEDELIRRKPIEELIYTFKNTDDDLQSGTLLKFVLCQIEDPKISEFMRSRLSDSITEENYYSAMYLAKNGDTTAMGILNRGFEQWPVATAQIAYTADLFGKYNYMASIRNLVGSLETVSLNLDYAALRSLKKLFPDSPEFKSLHEAKEYYLKILQ